ncbi:MAG: zinc-dependent metalloprotease, partial [Planctomycetales bacterium]
MRLSLQFALPMMVLSSLAAGQILADESDPASPAALVPAKQATASPPESTKAAKATKATSKSAPKAAVPKHVALLKDAKRHAGLLTLFEKDNHLFAELTASDYDKNLIVLISIARGVGQGVIMPGMTWKNDEDWVWQFRKAGKRVLVVRRNLRFRAKAGSPQAEAVNNAYTDSVLFSLPILTKGPKGGDLVDLASVFMTDLPQISQSVPGFAFSKDRSIWSAVKSFSDNVELQVAATYASSGSKEFIAVPDSRAMTVNVHYSISHLQKTGYKPRLADDRIGYFLTAIMDYSKQTHHDRFVRYIERWDLRKAEPSAKFSPPKKPIVFWIENTVPYKFRKPIREGILEWNRAFEKAGFLDAIEVRQQPEKSDWDPEDINYNTVRWITAGEGIAYGPSRVDPTSGQILDADILIDADFMQFSEELYKTFTDKSKAADGIAIDQNIVDRGATGNMPFVGESTPHQCQLHQGLARDYIMMASKADPVELETMVMQGLKNAVMHEVGHTLGLRHNFKSSTVVSIKGLETPEAERDVTEIPSVMDYTPAFLAPQDGKQTEYYATTIGAYDYWAIEYGYKPMAGGNPQAELPALHKIAARSAEPGLTYGTDEDTRHGDPDPLSQRFDLGTDPIEFAEYRAKLMDELIPDVVDRVVEKGENYSQARRSFGILLALRASAMRMAARNIGGIYVHRSHKDDPKAQAPFVVVDAKKQRESLQLLENEVFNDKPFSFPPKLYNHLASSRWRHWGMSMSDRADYPV